MPLTQKWLAMKATDGIDRYMIVNQGFTVIAYIFKGKHGAKCWSFLGIGHGCLFLYQNGGHY